MNQINMDHTIVNYSKEADEKKKLNCLKFYKWAMENKLTSFGMVIADNQYYHKPLEARRDILSAPSVDFLCKTIVFENTAYDPKFEGKFYPKYVAVMVQYVAKIHTEKFNRVMREWQKGNSAVKASKQHFHFRLAEEALSNEMTGYEHNGVVPVMMKVPMPIVFSDRIQKLVPQFFWMGGGHPDIKMRLSFLDFKTSYPDSVIVEDITYE